MITLNIEDLTIKQIIEICKEHDKRGTCKRCPIKNYCNANFVGEPQFFNENTNEDLVNVEVNEA